MITVMTVMIIVRIVITLIAVAATQIIKKNN